MSKVSIITATHNRHDLLIRAMKSVKAQTFTDWEHIIVADGRDPELAPFLQVNAPHEYRLVELGRNWCGVTGNKCQGGIPRHVGAYLAGGEYIAYLDDDNEYLPNHLEDLVAKIEEGYDFVYGIAEIVRQDRSFEMYIGEGELKFGNIDTSMPLHRWDLITRANWKGERWGDDWELFEAWIKSGIRIGWVPKVTLRYYRKY